MRRTNPVLVALAAAASIATAPAPLGAQAGPRLPADGGAPVPDPAAHVADQVRRVLRAEGRDASAWRALSEALPQMAVAGGAEISSTFAAAGLAREAGGAEAGSGAAVPVPDDGNALHAGGAPSAVVETLRGLDAGLLGTLLAVVAVAVVLRRTTGSSAPRLARRRRFARARPHDAALPASRPLAEVRDLAASGLSVPEVARRTRCSREVVTVLIQVGAS